MFKFDPVRVDSETVCFPACSCCGFACYECSRTVLKISANLVVNLCSVISYLKFYLSFLNNKKNYTLMQKRHTV